MTRRIALTAALALLVATAGCGPLLVFTAISTAGTGAYVWQQGWVQQTLEQPHDRVFKATRSALNDLDVIIESDKLFDDSSVFDGYDKRSNRVMVKTKVTGDKATQVRICVGLWGDQDGSLKILDQIKKHL